MPSAIRRDIGQLLIGSLAGKTITPELRSLAREFSLGGVILFSRNIEAPEQVAELSIDTQTLAGEMPLWVSVDQEGGRVARLRKPFTEWPPMAVLGRSGSTELAAWQPLDAVPGLVRVRMVDIALRLWRERPAAGRATAVE